MYVRKWGRSTHELSKERNPKKHEFAKGNRRAYKIKKGCIVGSDPPPFFFVFLLNHQLLVSIARQTMQMEMCFPSCSFTMAPISSFLVQKQPPVIGRSTPLCSPMKHITIRIPTATVVVNSEAAENQNQELGETMLTRDSE